jgi:cytochrome b561
MSFIREFNFLVIHWIYPVLVVFAVFVFLVIRDFKKIKEATIQFFSIPASSWLLSGFLVTYIFSRLLGRSKFWKLLYNEESYRLAKAASEEGVELLGNAIMLIGAIEFLIYYFAIQRIKNEKL